MSENKPAGQLPVPGIALVLVLLGLWAISDPPFKPSRPANAPDLTSAAEDVTARLWQDPFQAVEIHRRDKHAGEKSEKNCQGNQCDEQKNSIANYQENSELSRHTLFQDRHHRLCGVQDTGSTGAGADGSDPADNGPRRFTGLEKSAHTIHELRCQIQRDVVVYPDRDVDVQILAVMVPGGPYAENRESRIRNRYAVITGLSSTAYIPKDAEHIGYMDFSALCEVALVDPAAPSYCDWPAAIPYEWFVVDPARRLQDPASRIAETVLVLWVSEEELARFKPLKMLDRLRDSLTPGMHEGTIQPLNHQGKEIRKRVKTRLDVIGPGSSTSLIKMYQEAIREKQNSNSRYLDNFNNGTIRLISPRVTIDDTAIKRLLEKHENTKLESLLKFHRAIASDEEMVENILCELIRRGINPFSISDDVSLKACNCSDYLVSQLNRSGRQDHLVLIGEWDTLYSRNFDGLFKRLLAKNEGKDPYWLHRFSYLRGIDGATSTDSKKSASSADKDLDADKKSLRRAIGENQFDYLRRLGDEIEKLSDRVEAKEGIIRSIGIVGSDTYDKLLILQALRVRFPDKVFFTTDLDARMLHREENEWARNLVVASGYGLVPERADVSFEGLPFRDSYQTSVYLTIRDIVKVGQLEEPRCMPVKMFEIGNRIAVDYSHQGQCATIDGQTVDMSASGTSTVSSLAASFPGSFDTGRFFLYLGLSVLLFLLLIVQTSNESRKYVIVLASVLYILVAWLITYQPQHSIEFRNMLSGTSIWPAIIIRMLAGILAIISIFYVLSTLRNNNRRIIETNGLDSVFSINHSFGERICNELRTLNRKNARRGFSINIRNVAHVIYKQLTNSFRSSNVLDETKVEEGCLKCQRLFSRLCISIWGWDFEETKPMPLETLVYQYLYLGRTRSWLPRVAFMWIVYIALTFAFMKSFPSMPFTPFNGSISAAASSASLFVAVFSYLFLIFLVVDVTRLNAQFVDLLSRYSFHWPKKMVTEYCANYGVNEEVATEKLKLELIVRRTKAVDVLIFLPFVILSLMIISRSDYFDRWHMPMSLAFVILLGALIALSSAVRLRRSARKARLMAINRLEDIYRKQLYRQSKHEVSSTSVSVGRCTHMMPERIKVVVDDIRNINAGPFVPLSRHPIVAAVAMPFGGVGGLYLIEYLASVGL